MFKAIFPGSYATAMQIMNKVAFITATRYTRKKVVTVSSDRINFTKRIPAGTIIELIGKVAHVENVRKKSPPMVGGLDTLAARVGSELVVSR
jgi:hypothetical protein